MDNSKNRVNIRVAAFIMAVLMAASVMVLFTYISNAEDSEGKKINIKVVEDIPAQDIEEADVPLAAMPVSDTGNAVRHICMMLALFILTAAYALYFIGYEKRLTVLRRQAADAELKAMKKRRAAEGRR